LCLFPDKILVNSPGIPFIPDPDFFYAADPGKG
jgi:hypothetical protein